VALSFVERRTCELTKPLTSLYQGIELNEIGLYPGSVLMTHTPPDEAVFLVCWKSLEFSYKPLKATNKYDILTEGVPVAKERTSNKVADAE
jgi:hypothetical protein